MDIMYTKQLATFNLIYRELNGIYRDIAVRAGLSDSAFSILYSLCEANRTITQKDICDMKFLSKQTVHSSIRQLEEKGYLRLELINKKSKRLSLTAAGEALVAKTILPIIHAESKAFAVLTTAESSELLRLFQKYSSLTQSMFSQLTFESENT